jgi:uncharacterized damage-inducible protein DinB
MLRHFQMLSAYNCWANAQVYDACAALTDVEYREDRGAFFGSVHRTLNHILVADCIWLRRLTGEGAAPTDLGIVLFEEFSELRAARDTEDERITGYLGSLTNDALSATITYTPVTVPSEVTEPLAPILGHLFNHQTHHRGQVHAILTSLGKPSIVLDMIAFLRKDGKQWMQV